LLFCRRVNILTECHWSSTYRYSFRLGRPCYISVKKSTSKKNVRLLFPYNLEGIFVILLKNDIGSCLFELQRPSSNVYLKRCCGRTVPGFKEHRTAVESDSERLSPLSSSSSSGCDGG
jgi:hypothetical protein